MWSLLVLLFVQVCNRTLCYQWPTARTPVTGVLKLQVALRNQLLYQVRYTLYAPFRVGVHSCQAAGSCRLPSPQGKSFGHKYTYHSSDAQNNIPEGYGSLPSLTAFPRGFFAEACPRLACNGRRRGCARSAP